MTSLFHGDRYAPIALFGGIAPKLEVLEVRRLSLDWTSPSIHGLRQLNLSDMTGEVSVQQLLDVLASAPLLKHLDIRDSILDHHLQSLRISPAIIQIPSLTTIKFMGINARATAAILSSIRVPNCTVLAIFDWGDDQIGARSFPEPALSHFNDFLRLTLSINKASTAYFFDDRMTWSSESTGPSRLEFDFEIPYSSLTDGLGWVAQVLGLGAQELVHDMEIGLEHNILGDGDLGGYHSFSRCQSVTKLNLHYDHTCTKPILELLGTWRESDDGTGRLPAFPGLGVLTLAASEEWTLDDLEAMVSRRFGERGDCISQCIPNLSIVLQALPDPDSGPGSKPDMVQLQDLRAVNGVESLTQVLDKDTLGMLAAVYEDDTVL